MEQKRGMQPLMKVADAEKESMYGYIHTVSGPGGLPYISSFKYLLSEIAFRLI